MGWQTGVREQGRVPVLRNPTPSGFSLRLSAKNTVRTWTCIIGYRSTVLTVCVPLPQPARNKQAVYTSQETLPTSELGGLGGVWGGLLLGWLDSHWLFMICWEVEVWCFFVFIKIELIFMSCFRPQFNCVLWSISFTLSLLHTDVIISAAAECDCRNRRGKKHAASVSQTPVELLLSRFVSKASILCKIHFTSVYRTITCLSDPSASSPEIRKVYPLLLLPAPLFPKTHSSEKPFVTSPRG